MKNPAHKTAEQLLAHVESTVSSAFASYGSLLDHMEAVVDRQARRIVELEERCKVAADMLQSLKEERDHRRKFDDIKVEAVRRGLELLNAMLPTLLQRVVAPPDYVKQLDREIFETREFRDLVKTVVQDLVQKQPRRNKPKKVRK